MAFVSGPTGNLLGKFRIRPDGAGFKAKNAFALVASADEWFSPVAAEVGPDGNLWIADWYNFIIQHNPTPNAGRGGYEAKTGKGNAHVNPNRDRQHGRIYRLVWDKAPAATDHTPSHSASTPSSLSRPSPTPTSSGASPRNACSWTARRLDAVPNLKSSAPSQPGIAADPCALVPARPRRARRRHPPRRPAVRPTRSCAATRSAPCRSTRTASP